MTEPAHTHRAGYVAIIGRPNAGKSTLVNALLGQKVAAVSPRAQTTRRRQLGILTTPNYQIIFVDTPGLHQPRHKLGEYLNEQAEETLAEVDVIVWMVDAATDPGDDERRIAALLSAMRKRPAVLLAANKADLVPADALPLKLQRLRELFPAEEVMSVSATRGDGRESLLQSIISRLPAGEPEFPEEQITDYYERDIAVELIREACLTHLREEVPHGINVRMDEFTERGDTGAHITATIFVERESHKGIVIGEGGAMLKRIGSSARQQIEEMSGRKVFLELRVKVSKDWREDENVLRRFGYATSNKKKKGKR